MVETQDTPSIMVRLRDSTKALHDLTEHGEFNRQLVQGQLPLELYIESLGQLLLIHQCLEGHLRRHRASLSAIAAIVREYQYQEPYLRDDLAFFERDVGQIRPLPATSRFLAEIDGFSRSQPLALLGIQYVFEGSNNGSKFIAKAVRRAYGLRGSDGTQYLDPYGDRQKQYWEAFKSDMNAQRFSQEEAAAVLRAAAFAFEVVMALHCELHALAAAATSRV